MSDRLYIDPFSATVREERFIFEFARDLGLSYGQYFRIGVVNFARSLSEARLLSSALNEKYQALSSNDKDYLQRLLNYRIEQDKCQKKIEDTYNIRASFHQNDTPPPDLDPLHQDIIATLGMDLILEYAVRYKAEGGTVVSELVKLYKDQTQYCPVTTIYTSDIRDWLETIEWL